MLPQPLNSQCAQVCFNQMISRLWLLYAACLVALCSTPPAVAGVNKSHAITLYDEAPKYGPDCEHFGYVNPSAPVEVSFLTAP